MNNKIILFLGIFFLIGAMFFVESDGSGGGIFDKDKKIVACEIDVKNRLGFRTNIADYRCTFEETSVCLSNPFALGDDNDIKVLFQMGGKTDSASTFVKEGDIETLMVSVCVDKSYESGRIILSDLNGEVEREQITV